MQIWRADLREISSWDLSMRMGNSWWMVLPESTGIPAKKKLGWVCRHLQHPCVKYSQWFSQWLLLKTLWWQRIWSVLSLLVGTSFCLVTCVILAGAHTLAEPWGFWQPWLPWSFPSLHYLLLLKRQSWASPATKASAALVPRALPFLLLPLFILGYRSASLCPSSDSHWCLIYLHCSPECQEPGSSNTLGLERQKTLFLLCLFSGGKN